MTGRPRAGQIAGIYTAEYVMRPIPLLPLVVVALTIAACQRHERVPMPDIRINPQPQEKYEITMRVVGAPRPFEKVIGTAQYDIPDHDDACIPTDYTIAPLSGIKNRPSKDMPVEWHKVSDTEYRTEVYLDALLDEDYYGLGTCRWYLTAVRAKLISEPAIFVTSIVNKLLLSGQEGVTFANKEFFNSPPPSFGFYSMLKPGKYQPGDGQFQINFTARKVMP
ncbi:hypothetical protein EBB59_12060 [Lysobacter pythonis]|uniref:Uncharacterized protein n=1 Tax=Solilutibacter pythonis TaxID=2483112 RepID=A0A3M2HEH2_9GAMM|nr:hypothetical protein [Lysobacter pythonis]RMH88101.1 hypothetical protein EBB59_12060 [Lysobacter pythonis]